MNRHIFTIKHPATWYGEQWREALPLGNGLTGVLLPGSIAYESIHFNRHDLWHNGNPGGEIPDVTDAFREMRRMIDEGDYASANQDNIMHALFDKGYRASVEKPYPLGWLKMTFAPESMFRHYERGVNMRTGEAFVDFMIGEHAYHRRMFVSRDCDVTAIRMYADCEFTTEYAFALFTGNGTYELNGKGFTCVSEDGDTAASVAFLGEFTCEQKEGALSVTGKDYTVLVRVSSHKSRLDLDDVLNETYESLFEKHTSLHTPLYDSLSIELSEDEDQKASNEEMLDEAYEDQASPALMERLWRFGRYLFISGSCETSNPIPLYGLWHGGDNLQWSQYTANENVEITYWHALAGGLSYAIPPLLRHFTSKIDSFRECAQKVFGMKGIWVSAYTSPNVAGVAVAVAVISNWISCAGWMCRHFWEYYLYTQDEKLLREEILPFMYEAALFFKDYAVIENGKVRLYPSVSPENTPKNLFDLATRSASGHKCPAVENATMDFAVMKELFRNLLSGMEITGMYLEEKAEFEQLLQMIPEYQINEDGAVKEWMHENLSDNYSHRHLSHLYPVFPGNEVTANNNPALFEAFRRAVHLRKLGSQSGWSLAHMASIYARLGEGEKTAECLDILSKSVVLTSLMTVHNDWRHMGMTVDWKEAPVQLDAAFGAVNAVQEMLFYWQEKEISVLPALPERLSKGAFTGMAFPGGEADASWEKDGSVNITIRAARDLDSQLLVGGKSAGRISLKAGESRTWKVSR